MNIEVPFFALFLVLVGMLLHYILTSLVCRMLNLDYNKYAEQMHKAPRLIKKYLRFWVSMTVVATFVWFMVGQPSANSMPALLRWAFYPMNWAVECVALWVLYKYAAFRARRVYSDNLV